MSVLFQANNCHFIVGASDSMKKVYSSIEKAARSDLPVLLTGETGVGKEISANLIHQLSFRKTSPFVKVNCAALSPNLIESELFGHEKGAFTGAETTRPGRVELANTGSFLLDEINEIDVRLQSKLLQVIEEGRFERVGSCFPQKVDVRFISTCNKDLKDLINNGSFRADLYYRLNVVNIHIPPLRSRKDDIIPLIDSFLGEHYCSLSMSAKNLFHPSSINMLCDYSWPGNIRELFNFLRRIMLLGPNENVMPETICEIIGVNESVALFRAQPLAEIEKDTIKSTLSYFQGNLQKASHILGITDRTLRNKIKQYEINNERGRRKDVIYG